LRSSRDSGATLLDICPTEDFGKDLPPTSSTMITSFFKPTKSGNASSKRDRSDEPSDTENVDTLTGNDASKLTNKRSKTSDNDAVQQLLSYLPADQDEETPSWKSVLEKTWKKKSIFGRLARFVAQERSSKTIYPPADQTFTALHLTPLKSVKVVIVGQDPYHGPGQAHGLAFSVQKTHRPIPPSLKNMYKELIEDLAVPDFAEMPTHGCLEQWARQGVLMLNTVLTVQKGQAASHRSKGWEVLFQDMIRAVSSQSEKGVVFLLWGKPAFAAASGITSSSSKHVVIATSHPSPLGARKTATPFLTSRCFSRANSALVEMGHDPIDWTIS